MQSSKTLSVNRKAYIVEAAIEYFISLLVTDAFLATLLTRTGVSDATTGIITQLASLSFAAQLFSLFVNKRSGMKLWVTVLHLANQIMYLLLYIVPSFNVSKTVKVVAFVILFLGGHIIANIVSPYKISWLMSFVDNKERGRFTANKEIVSLIGGMVFSFAMGNLVDHFNEIGRENTGFILCGVTIFVLAVIHLVSLIVVKDNEDNVTIRKNNKASFETIKSLFTNKAFVKVVLMVAIWHVATGIAVSFYGTYKIHELGFSLTGVSVLGVVYALCRSSFSRFFGRYADKKSWAKMLILCFLIAAFAFFINIFTSPTEWGVYFEFAGKNISITGGQMMFTLYYATYGIALAGINSGMMNVVFDYVPNENRSAALGLSQSVGGFTSFFMSIVGSRILSSVQACGNKFLSIEVYGQQILSAISFFVCIILISYVKFVVLKLERIK